MRRKQLIAPLLIVMLLTAGCIKKSGSTTPVTPWERVTTDNAILAQAINSLERGAEAAVTSGVLGKAVGGQIIGLCGQAAQIQLQSNAILKTAPNVSTADLSTLQTLISQVGNSATALINSGQIGVKNPNSQQLFSADVQALVTLGESIVSDIQAAKGSQ